MNSNRIYMLKTLCALAIVAALFGIYVLAKPQGLTGSALADRDGKKRTERLAKLDLPCNSVSGTVLDVTGQIVTVQGTDSPCTISLVYVNGDLPIALAPGKTVITCGEFKKGLFVTDNITITGVTPGTAPDTSPQPLGLFDHMIFFISYWLYSGTLT
jgi:cytochrome c-type biogenesis protein CcmE